MTDIRVIFFDLGNTLGTAVLLEPPDDPLRFDVFDGMTHLLRSLREREMRLGIISNTGDLPGSALDRALGQAGILEFFESKLCVYSKDVGLEKNSTKIFRLAADRTAIHDGARQCLFVGEDGVERAFAAEAGMWTSPSPTSIDQILKQ